MKMLFWKRIIAASLGCAAAVCACADLQMPKIFSDGMVLQADQNNRIWGLSTAKQVSVKIGGYYRTCEVENGKWQTVLPALEASFEPTQIVILEDGKVSKKISDVLIGEVWISGGQSNMAFRMRGEKSLKNAKESVGKTVVRRFSQPESEMAKRAQFDTGTNSFWSGANADTLEDFGAVGYLFARSLSERLGTPVAIVETATSGTRMIAWLDIEDAKKCKPYADYIANKLPTEKRKFLHPELLYNAKIAPIAGYGARGFIWYQGESDTSDTQNGAFKAKFETLVNAWRKYWKNDGMPFLFVQLPSFTTGPRWVDAREQQRESAEELDEVYMACTIDTGEEKDIHPKDKTPVAERLSRLALEKVYALEDIVSDAPKLESVSYEGDKAYIYIDVQADKLVFRSPTRGFEILVGGQWKYAPARLISECAIEIENPERGSIDGVRYLWRPWAKPFAAVYDDSGLPLQQFFNLKK